MDDKEIIDNEAAVLNILALMDLVRKHGSDKTNAEILAMAGATTISGRQESADALDAARYRWLRENNWFAANIIHIAEWGRSAHETK